MVVPVPAASAPSARDLSLSRPDTIVLADVGQRLLDRGCSAALADVGGCGALDVRLLVGRADHAVTVEVLGPADGAGHLGRWHAVRVDADGVRCVWAGPDRSSSTEALVAFVGDLLGEHPGPLAARYLAVG